MQVNGVIHAVKTQINIRTQLVITVVVVTMGIIFKVSKIEFMFLIFSIFSVLITETINTAIEATVDLYTETFHEKAKIAKDIAAGAVILSAIGSIAIAIFVFYDKIF